MLGCCWDLAAASLIVMVEKINQIEGVIQTSLLGNLVHAIIDPKAITKDQLQASLSQLSLAEVTLSAGEITL